MVGNAISNPLMIVSMHQYAYKNRVGLQSTFFNYCLWCGNLCLVEKKNWNSLILNNSNKRDMV